MLLLFIHAKFSAFLVFLFKHRNNNGFWNIQFSSLAALPKSWILHKADGV